MALVALGEEVGWGPWVGLGSVKSGPIALLSKKPSDSVGRGAIAITREEESTQWGDLCGPFVGSPLPTGPPWGLAVSSSFCHVRWEDQLLKN